MAQRPSVPSLKHVRDMLFLTPKAWLGKLSVSLGLFEGRVKIVADSMPSFGVLLNASGESAGDAITHIFVNFTREIDVPRYYRFWRLICESDLLDMRALDRLWHAVGRENKVIGSLSAFSSKYSQIMVDNLPQIVVDMMIALYWSGYKLDVAAINREIYLGYLQWNECMAVIPGLMSQASQFLKQRQDEKALEPYQLAITEFIMAHVTRVIDVELTREAIERAILKCINKGVHKAYGTDLVIAYALYKGWYESFMASLTRFYFVAKDPRGIFKNTFLHEVAEWSAGKVKSQPSDGPYAQINCKRKKGDFIRLIPRLERELK